MFKISKIIFSCLAIGIVLFSCDLLEEDAAEQEVTIRTVGWVLVNEGIDDGEDIDEASVKIYFYIHFEEENINASEISSLKIRSVIDNRSWTYTDPDFFDFAFNGERIQANIYNSSTLDRMALGYYNFDVTLTNGESASFTLNVPAPNSTSTDGYDYIYNEDYIDSNTISDNYTQLPKRAQNTSGTYNSKSDELTVNFTADQSMIYNGSILLYNSEGTYIGYSTHFRDFTTGEVSSICNSGITLYTNGTNNTISLTDTDITFFDTSNTLSDVTVFKVILKDGYQYDGTDHTYDCKSYTSKIAID